MFLPDNSQMTVFLPLNASSPLPALPTFLVPPANSASHLARVIQAIMKAKRIVVICGSLMCVLSYPLAYLFCYKVLEYLCKLAFQTSDPPMVSSKLSNAITPAKPCRQAKNSLTLLFSMWVNRLV
jgi:hypothetical protein